VKGRKPKLAVVPETQVEEVSVVVEEEEEEEVEFVAGPRQGSILPSSVARKPSFEVCHQESVVLILASCEEQSSQRITDSSRKEFRLIQRTCRKTIQR
jgi:hypothetical protein